MRLDSSRKVSSRTDSAVLFMLFLGYLFFAFAFYLENVLSPYSSKFLIEGLVLVSRLVFLFIALFCSLAFYKRKAPVARILVLAVALFYTAAGISGSIFNMHDDIGVFVAHLSVYVQFFLMVFGLSLISLQNDDFIVAILRLFSYIILFVNIIFVFGLFVFVDVGLYISASLYSIGFSLSYFISSRKNHGAGVLSVVLVSIFSLKRGLLLATLMHWLFTVKFKLKSLFFALFSLLAILILAYGIYQQFPDAFFSKLIESNISRSLESGSSVDAVSSGRVSIMIAVFNELSGIYKFIFGSGFGVIFDAYGFLEGRSAEWLTSGVDVIFGHFWLLHGVVLGTILSALVSFSIFYMFFTSYYKSDVIFAFFVNLLAFNYLVSLTSFTPWDPVWGLATGLLLARYRVLRRRKDFRVNVDNSVGQE